MVNIMSKRSEITQRQQSENYQSISSKDLAAWASNHNGWSKMKKKNRKKFFLRPLLVGAKKSL